MSDKCTCEHTQHHCTLAENCKVALMCKRVIESDTVNIDCAEYEAMKEEIVSYKGLLRQLENVAINTKSIMAVMTYIKEARKAIDQARKICTHL